MLEVQFRDVNGNDLDQFKENAKEVILLPAAYKTGDLAYPYAAATP